MAGRVRKKLATLLASYGFVVAPDDLLTQRGDYRKRRWDLAIWLSNRAKRGDRVVDIASWDTMTECVRFGISNVAPTRSGFYEVFANDGPIASANSAESEG